MQLAFSNIAWNVDEDALVSDVLAKTGITAIEVAPARLHHAPLAATPREIQSLREHWAAAGLPIRSMQALLYGRHDLHLFGTDDQRRELTDYLRQIIGFASGLGAGPLVFGSPKNRLKGQLSFSEACALAVPVFREVGEIAAHAGTVFCIEANALDYGCDFMVNLEEAAEVVRQVDHSAVGLVVDTGNMAMAGDTESEIAKHAHLIRHLHLSRPHLAPLDEKDPFPGRVLAAVQSAGYSGIATVEMRRPEKDTGAVISRCAELAQYWLAQS